MFRFTLYDAVGLVVGLAILGGLFILLKREFSGRSPGRDERITVHQAKAELRRRYANGERSAVAEYLEQFPHLRSRVDWVLDLVYEEYCLREEVGEVPDRERFLAVYSPWRSELEKQLRFHDILNELI